MGLSRKIQFWFVGLAAIAELLSVNGMALDQNGVGDTSNVVALYTFKEGTGNVVHDQISNGGALDLTITGAPGSYSWVPDSSTQVHGLQINTPVFIQSAGPATKIINACNASGAMTIEAWVSSQLSDQVILPVNGPARIVALSNGVLNKGGIYLGQGYNAGNFFNLGINTMWTLNKGVYSETPSNEEFNTPTSDPTVVRLNQDEHIYAVRDKMGNITMWVSDQYGTPNEEIPVSGPAPVDPTAKLNLANNLYLTLANDINPNGTTYPVVSSAEPQPISDKHWYGKLEMVAVYCTALSENQMLGAMAPTDWLANITNYSINPNTTITPALTMARTLYQRVAGLSLPIDHPTLTKMATILAANPNDEATRIQAADVAASDPGFYNITVSNFAKPMSNVAGQTQIPLNDFVASIIGATRDGMDARHILTDDFYYIGDPNKTAVKRDPVQSFVLSDDHYSQLESLGYDLSSVLVKETGQKYWTGTGDSSSDFVPASNYDVAGIITSRQFGSEALSAGTNRRAIRFSFNSFLCEDITQWADATAPDSYVGMDVDRFPTGDHTVYQTTCRSCHAQMDAMRPAFAHLTFEDGFLKHAWVVPEDTTITAKAPLTVADEANNEMNTNAMVNYPRGVSGKYNKNAYVFPSGYQVTDNSWINYTNRPGTANAAYFGWAAGTTSGSGVNAFANMIAQSKAYPMCLTRRVFQQVCKRAPTSADQPTLDYVDQQFTTTDQYQLKKLFERMAVQPDCLGQ